MLPRFLLPFFSVLEKYVFALAIILYPLAVYVKKNFGTIVIVFVLLQLSGLTRATVKNMYFLDTIVVFAIYAVGFFGFKTFFDSWKAKDGKKAWNMMGLGFMVFVLMWFCLQLLVGQLGVTT